MKTHRSFLRSASATLLGLAAGVSLVASAGGPAQPDPPVPELAVRVSTATRREPECGCAVLRVRDIESRVEGHIERWEAMPRSDAEARRASGDASFVPLRLTAFVEGVVGFPMRQYRLASDEEGGAGGH